MHATHKRPPPRCGISSVFRSALLGLFLCLAPGSITALEAVQNAVGPPQAPTAGYSLPDDPKELIHLDNEMKLFFASRINRKASTETILDQIAEAILGEKGLRFRYEGHGVYDVREAFRRQRGNCLTYSMLVVALAREYNVDAKFNMVQVYPRWNRTSGIVLLNGHINVRVDTPKESYELDVKLDQDYSAGRDSTRVIDDARAFSGVYNNVGVYELVAGNHAAALQLMEKAAAIDPTSSSAWTNLGSAFNVTGQPDRAQRCYELALASEPGVPAALSGLAMLHRKNGRIADAEKLERKVLRFREKNPYYLLSIARDELTGGNFKSARRHLKRAINIKDDEPELYELMAEVARRQGLDSEAKRWIEKSKKKETS